MGGELLGEEELVSVLRREVGDEAGLERGEFFGIFERENG